MTRAGTGDLYTLTRKLQGALKSRETKMLGALGPPGAIAAFGARHCRWRLEEVE
jgi:hypothetical protein